jgi:hypothetical protein
MTEGKNRIMIYGPKEVITQDGPFLLRQPVRLCYG